MTNNIASHLDTNTSPETLVVRITTSTFLSYEWWQEYYSRPESNIRVWIYMWSLDFLGVCFVKTSSSLIISHHWSLCAWHFKDRGCGVGEGFYKNGRHCFLYGFQWKSRKMLLRNWRLVVSGRRYMLRFIPVPTSRQCVIPGRLGECEGINDAILLHLKKRIKIRRSCLSLK